MSRGDRSAVNGILSSSMRDNYGEYGVDEYYKKVGSTYRNPHYPGVRLCLFSWLNRWWQMEQESFSAKKESDSSEREGNLTESDSRIMVFDMACGSGEATLGFIEWWKTGKKLYAQSIALTPTKDLKSSTGLPLPRRKTQIIPVALGSEFPRPCIMAADPYTSEAFVSRTSLPCSSLSFKAISEGALPPSASDLSKEPVVEVPVTSSGSVDDTLENEDVENEEDVAKNTVVEMVICSFALHLVENPSELFSLLWELSSKAKWLVILAPHKKPEIKDGWGWSKWNIDTWKELSMSENSGELLHDRVHCRVYKSLNI